MGGGLERCAVDGDEQAPLVAVSSGFVCTTTPDRLLGRIAAGVLPVWFAHPQLVVAWQGGRAASQHSRRRQASKNLSLSTHASQQASQHPQWPHLHTGTWHIEYVAKLAGQRAQRLLQCAQFIRHVTTHNQHVAPAGTVGLGVGLGVEWKRCKCCSNRM